LSHELFMSRALELAEKGRGKTSPNPLVGAVVVRSGRIVGEGYHQMAGTPHAEIHALRDAGEKAKGAIMYVTLEPCCHYGRTPPCTEAIIEKGIKEVVVGAADPNPLVAGKGIKTLEDAGVRVITGVLEKDAQRQNEAFIKYIRSGRPFITLKAAISQDGKIATKISYGIFSIIIIHGGFFCRFAHQNSISLHGVVQSFRIATGLIRIGTDFACATTFVRQYKIICQIRLYRSFQLIGKLFEISHSTHHSVKIKRAIQYILASKNEHGVVSQATVFAFFHCPNSWRTRPRLSVLPA
jgi:pyrimidine deaminase RibD-like protein